MTDSQFFDSTPKFVCLPTKVICPKHGTHSHTIDSNIQGHEGHWCMICALEKLGEPLQTTDDDCRPKPPSLKEQALAALQEAAYMADDSPPQGICSDQIDTIRRALEALPND